MRAGPARDYPVQWVYTRKNLPVEITLEYGSWRKIRDPDGDTGWIHQSLLSPHRYARIEHRDEVIAYRRPDHNSQPAIRLEPGVIARLKQCERQFCELNVGGYAGWVQRKMLWGIYAEEKLD
jgi:SH3-like domain-containing protein